MARVVVAAAWGRTRGAGGRRGGRRHPRPRRRRDRGARRRAPPGRLDALQRRDGERPPADDCAWGAKPRASSPGSAPTGERFFSALDPVDHIVSLVDHSMFGESLDRRLRTNAPRHDFPEQPPRRAALGHRRSGSSTSRRNSATARPWPSTHTGMSSRSCEKRPSEARPKRSCVSAEAPPKRPHDEKRRSAETPEDRATPPEPTPGLEPGTPSLRVKCSTS
jgi:hypothetical protein